MVPSGNETATFPFEVQCLNQLRHGVPPSNSVRFLYHDQDSSGLVISPTQRILPDNPQDSLETGIHAPGGIRTHNPSKRAATDSRLRPRGPWDRLIAVVGQLNQGHKPYECTKKT